MPVAAEKADAKKADAKKTDAKKAEPPQPKLPRTGGLEDPIHRTKGPLRGSFVMHEQRYVAGEPIFVRFHLEAVGTEPLRFTIGGDGYQQGPLRFTWLVRDAMDEVVCDLRGRPEPMAGGGGRGEISLENGKTYDHWLAPQTGCAALSKPGRYRLRVVRILTDDSKAPPSCPTMLVPDTTKKPIDDRGVPLTPECEKWLDAAPAIASDFEIEIGEYDAEKLKAAVTRELAIGGDGRMNLLSSYGAWLCGKIGCEAGYGDKVDEWLTKGLAKLPERFP
ncbi:MAG TPA: hypothetical protein VG755_33515 [Nannocystaceae bacterium]|nr:hypothetical protein [Nannocystaceae bacterium]